MRTITHQLDVTRAETPLHVHQPFTSRVLLTQQIGHQRLHARADEQSGGIIFGNKRALRDTHMAALSEEIKEFAAQLGGGDSVVLHGSSLINGLLVQKKPAA